MDPEGEEEDESAADAEGEFADLEGGLEILAECAENLQRPGGFPTGPPLQA